MKRTHRAIFAILAAILFLAASCGNLLGPKLESGEGDIHVSLASPFARSLLPDFATPATYDITATRAGFAPKLLANAAGTEHSLTGLAPGLWGVLVIGKNASGEQVASGSGSVTVVANVATPLTVSIAYSATGGSGNLELTYVFPDSIGLTAVSFALKKMGETSFSGETSFVPVDTDPTGPNSQVVYATSLDCDSYTLRVLFKKGGITLCTVIEAVQIYQNLDTHPTITLAEGDFRSPPAAPGAPAAVDRELNQIRLTWDAAGVTTETGYKIERHISSDYSDASPASFTSIAANTSLYDDASVAPLTDYYYRIASINDYGQSAWATFAGPIQATKVVNGDFHLTDSVTLANLQGTTKVIGTLHVYGGVPSLDGLTSLKTVGGLSVHDTSLTSLSGLSGLESAGFLSVYSNGSMTSLDGLQGLTSVIGYVYICNNSNLTSLTGLDNVATIGTAGDAINDDYLIVQANKLPHLTGLGNLGAVRGYVKIDDNDFLQDLAGLENLAFIGDAEESSDDYLSIINNALLFSTLTDLDAGLYRLEDVKGHIYVNANPELRDVELPALKTVGTYFEVRGNAKLEAISALGQAATPVTVGTYVMIGCYPWIGGDPNPLLANLSGLGNIGSIGTDLAIYQTVATSMNFAKLTAIGGRLWMANNNQLQTLQAPELLTVGSHLELYEAAAATSISMPKLASVGGYFWLRNQDGVGLSLDFVALDTVGDCLRIEDCNGLVNLAMGDLDSVGHDTDATDDFVDIKANPLLETISFAWLTDVDGFVYLTGPKIASISMPELLTIGGYLYFNEVDGTATTVSMDKLTDVGGYLSFNYCDTIQNAYFPALARVGSWFTVHCNSALLTINLPAIESIGGNIYIDWNHMLTTIEGFNSPLFTTINGRFTIGWYWGNNSLQTISGFQNVTAIIPGPGDGATFNGDFMIRAAPLLSSVTGFGNLASVSGNCQILSTGLTGLGFLDALETVGGMLEIATNPSLTSIAGLALLDSVGLESGGDRGIDINDNDSLSFQNLDGLQGVSSIGGSLHIRGNANLATAFSTGTCTITSLGRDIFINDNPYLLNLNNLNIASSARNLSVYSCDRLQSLSGLNDITGLTGYLNIGGTLPDLGALDFPSLTSIAGNVTITGTNLSSLTGLENLASIGGNLNVDGNDNASLPGLTELTDLGAIGGDLRVAYNDGAAFTSLGLPGLASVGGEFNMENDSKLQNFTGISTAFTIGGRIRIWENDALTSIDGLKGLPTDAIVNGELVANNNDLLENLEGLNDIQRVTGNVYFWNNSALQTIFTTTAHLTEINGELQIGGSDGGDQRTLNEALLDLNGLSTLTTVGGNLWIDDCGNLADLSGLGGLSTLSGGFNLRYCADSCIAPTSLPAFASLTHIGGDFRVENIDSIANTTGSLGFTNLTSILGTARFLNNALLQDATIASWLSGKSYGGTEISGNAP